MTFATRIFISYAHLDNRSAIPGHEWVTNFHRELEIRVAELLGEDARIWRDEKLRGNDDLTNELIDLVKHSEVLVSILTPRYLKSEWTLRELKEFCAAAEIGCGLTLGNKSRLFKVVKTPVRPEMEVAPLTRFRGYEFFKFDATGKSLELDPLDSQELREFRTKVNDVAHEIRPVLEELERGTAPAPVASDKKTVYVAETTSDLAGVYDALKRDLQQHGHTVLPSLSLPKVGAELVSFLRSELEKSDLSVQLIGRNYSYVPEGSKQSVLELEDELAAERAAKGNFMQIVWIPKELQIEDDRQRSFVEHIRMSPRSPGVADLLESSVEDLKTVLHEKLQPKAPIPAANPQNSTTQAESAKQIYVICDLQDKNSVRPWKTFLFEQGFDVLCSLFEGDETEIREAHNECLRTCEAVLIYYSAGSEAWLNKKLNEIQKSVASRKESGKAFPAVAVLLLPPKSPDEPVYRKWVTTIPQQDGITTASLLPFLARLKTS